MNRSLARLGLVLLGIATLATSPALFAQTQPATSPTTEPAATQPAATQPTTRPRRIPQADEPAIKRNERDRFLQMHQSFLDRTQQGPVDLLFLGDSITEWWSQAPDVFNKYYGNYQTANFGIAGDQTQHLLWRITNGELDNIKPKVVVLLIGINNGQNTAEQIAAAHKKIIEVIREKLPESRILLLAVFHNGADPAKADWVGPQRARIRTLNKILSTYDDGDHVRYLDITKSFLDDQDRILLDLMPDALHPSPKGYEVWAQSMQPLLDEMMKQ